MIAGAKDPGPGSFKRQCPGRTCVYTCRKKTRLHPAGAAVTFHYFSVRGPEAYDIHGACKGTEPAADAVFCISYDKSGLIPFYAAFFTCVNTLSAVNAVYKPVCNSILFFNCFNTAQRFLTVLCVHIPLVVARHLTRTAACAHFGKIFDLHNLIFSILHLTHLYPGKPEYGSLCSGLSSVFTSAAAYPWANATILSGTAMVGCTLIRMEP